MVMWARSYARTVSCVWYKVDGLHEKTGEVARMNLSPSENGLRMNSFSTVL